MQRPYLTDILKIEKQIHNAYQSVICILAKPHFFFQTILDADVDHSSEEVKTMYWETLIDVTGLLSKL